MQKIDSYTQRFILAIKKAKNKKELADIIDKIYGDGYDDGFNDTENTNIKIK